MSEVEESTYDPNKVDAYARHLAKVNESKQVVATQDICNDQGAILIKAGQPITGKTTERIVKFKLLKPIEESVAIEGDIDGSALFKHIKAILSKNEVAIKIHEQLELESALKNLCHFYQTFPILRQKITVLSLQMKRVYTQSLFSAWVVTVIGNQMNLPKVEMENLFIAAIAHDIGMLHIDEEVINKKGGLTPEEWRQIYAHPIIGEKILQNIPGIEKETMRAVREHHERCDGTGYPRGKFEKELAIHGQIIAMADSVVAILARMRSEGRNFRDLIPVIQINSQAHFQGTYEALVLVLRKANLGDEGIISHDAMPGFIDRVLFINKFLSEWLHVSEEHIMALGFTHQNRKLHMIQTVLMNVAIAVRGAGILDEGYIRFLEQVKSDQLEFAYREIEDVYIMLSEIRFHLDRLERFIKEFLEFQEKPDKEMEEGLRKALASITGVREKYADGDPAKYNVEAS
ncbi:MAG: HD domain-containing phosphohydrolase [Ketobacteraceae bacterium]|nr:HD domain-containing phosphohydrolase [Ketobacteraceae bacterium]